MARGERRMSGPPNSPWAPILFLLVVLATDVWTYLDAKTLAARGTPVVFSSEHVELSTPTGWFLGSLVLWILVFPLYITCRRRAAGQ